MRAAEMRGFSGVVRVSVGGSTVLHKGYGMANREARIPFARTTIVQIGSNTKDFTVVALLQLVQRGRLHWNDSLFKFFPDMPADKRAITLAQIVDHRAGFPDFVGEAGDFEPVGREEFLARVMKRPLVNQPGTKEAYSNAGYSVLAAIIERVSGVSYDVYVHDHIFAPLGMTNTGFALANFGARRLAHGYHDGKDIGTILGHPHPADGPYWMLRGNGGMSSTVDDMHTFYTALFTTTKLLKPEIRALHFDPNEPAGLAGSDGTSFFDYERFPRRGIEIIVASNNSNAPAPAVRRALAGVLGLSSGGEEHAAIPDRSSSVPPAGIHVPAAPVVALVEEFVRRFNAADVGALRTFVAERFAPDPAAPPIDQRVARMIQTRGNLGAITVTTVSEVAPDSIEVKGTSSVQGPLMITLNIEPGAKPRIRSMGVAVGG
ncbi:MAG: serine hydrolase domain-containing protein [bacterium]